MQQLLRLSLTVEVVVISEQAWYSTNEVAGFLKVDPSSLRRWRTARPPEGPPFVKVSPRKTLYSGRDLAAWMRAHRTDPGAET